MQRSFAMIKKQLWCQSSKALLSFLFLLSCVDILSMKEISQPEVFQGVPVDLLERVYKDSPERAKTIVSHLRSESSISRPNFRSAFFIGEPGTGKTTLAKAIAYKSGRELKFFSFAQFLGDQRNSSALNLWGDLDVLVAENKPVVVVIDEINRFLENEKSKHHDTDTSSAALWTFLDSQYGNHNFFLIGTTNRVDKLARPMKSRMMLRCVKLNTVVEPEKKAEIFLYHLSLLGCKPHQEVRAAFLKTIFGKLPVIAHRDLSELAQAVTFCYEEDKSSDSRIIKREHIKKAFEELQTIYPDFKYDIQEETDEEMRDRHHKESLTQQELHFVQQQKIQIAMQKTANCSDRGGVFERGIKEAEASLTDKQNQLYEDSVRSGRGQRAYKAYMNSSWWSSFF